MSDVAFVYDPEPFIKGLKTVFPEIDKLKKKFDSFVDSVSKGSEKAGKSAKHIGDAAKRALGSGTGGGGGNGPHFQTKEGEDLFKQFFGKGSGGGEASGMSKAMGEGGGGMEGMEGMKGMGGMGGAAGGAMKALGVVGIVLIGVGMLVKGLVTGIKKVFNAIAAGAPEVKQVFGAVKDIFVRNFFYPIRQFLLPYLQKILDWTRDHRAMFVKWGSVAVNVLRLVFNWAGKLWKIFLAVAHVAELVFKWIFGLKNNNMVDDINLLIAKVAIAGAFLTNIFGHLGVIVSGLASGLGKWAEGLALNIAHFAESAGKQIWSSLTGTFQKLSDFITSTLQAALSVVTNTLKGIEQTVTSIVQLFSSGIPSWVGDTARNVSGALGNLASQGRDITKQIASFLGLGGAPTPVHDAIISRGRVIRPDVNDTIIATKNPMGGGKIEQTVNVTLVVTEGNARRTGEEFGAGLQRGLRTALVDRMLYGGH